MDSLSNIVISNTLIASILAFSQTEIDTLDFAVKKSELDLERARAELDLHRATSEATEKELQQTMELAAKQLDEFVKRFPKHPDAEKYRKQIPATPSRR